MTRIQTTHYFFNGVCLILWLLAGLAFVYHAMVGGGILMFMGAFSNLMGTIFECIRTKRREKYSQFIVNLAEQIEQCI